MPMFGLHTLIHICKDAVTIVEVGRVKVRNNAIHLFCRLFRLGNCTYSQYLGPNLEMVRQHKVVCEARAMLGGHV